MILSYLLFLLFCGLGCGDKVEELVENSTTDWVWVEGLQTLHPLEQLKQSQDDTLSEVLMMGQLSRHTLDS